MKNYDVVIIGGGPAGASAALYTARSGLSTLVLEGGESTLSRAERIQNYYGASDNPTGAVLYARGLAQAAAVGAEIIERQATFASFDGQAFAVNIQGDTLKCKRLIIATGATRARADIAGLSEYEGRGVSYCAVCDAFFCRNKRVGVVGAGEYARHEYETLRAVAGEVVLFTDGGEPTFAADNVCTEKIKSVVGGENGRLTGVVTESGKTVALDALFVALGVMGSAAIAKSMGVLTDGSGAIITDARCMTNIAGLYAAGDCTAGIKQISRAVYEGMTAGLSAVEDLRSGR